MMSTPSTTAPLTLARRAAASAPRFVRRRGQLVVGALIVGLFYLAALGADFLAPYDYRAQSRGEPLAPPTAIHWREAGGAWHARPFIHPRRLLDPLARTYAEDATRRYSFALLTHSDRYRLFGIIDTDLHLFGVMNEAMYATAKMPRLNLLGTDALGRDRLSQLLVAARFSLVVGLLGTLAAGALGVFIGCVAGYAGRSADALLMRAADAMLALPDLVLILAARAAFPPELPPLRAGGLLVGIFVAVGWAGVARLTRGLVLALRQREFVLAAISLGLSQRRILFRHILPNAARPLVVQVSLLLPTFLIAETALSYLGVGLQEPAVSWGNMLIDAGNSTLLAQQPLMLLSPAFAIILFVFGVRLLSEGLRGRNPD